MKKITIFHNPRCRKSREALDYLNSKGIEVEVFEYLKTPLTKELLVNVFDKLSVRPIDVIRKGEDVYKTEFKGKDLSDYEWITAFIKHPKLIERPLIFNENGGVVGRPLENVIEFVG